MNREELASLQNKIDEAEQRVMDQQAVVADLRVRRRDTAGEEALLHIMLSALEALKEHRKKVQAYVELAERMKF